MRRNHDLIPTPIVDVNGRQTTVHRKAAENNSRLGALGAARPTLPPNQEADETWVVKGGIHPKSVCLLVPHIADGEFISRPHFKEPRPACDGVEMENSEVYEYLRLGIDPIDASVFKLAGYTPRDLPNDPAISEFLPGRLARLNSKGDPTSISNNDYSIDTMIAAGVPARKAASALSNGISEHHFKGVLGVPEVVELFMNNSYKRDSTTPPASKSAVIDAIVRGDIPMDFAVKARFDCLVLTARDLDGAQKEKFARLRTMYPERYNELLAKAARFKLGIADIDYLTRKYTNSVFDLQEPKLADRDSYRTGRKVGVAGAAYLESVKKHLVSVKSTVLADWGKDASKHPGYNQRGGAVSRLKFEDVLELGAAGASPETVNDLLVVRGLPIREAAAIARGDTILPLSDGYL